MKSYRRTGATELSIDILEYLSNQKGPVSGKQISDAMGLPYGTVMSHLATLEYKNCVKSVGECFKLGMKLAMFWSRTKAWKENDKAESERDIRALETGITEYGGML
ncbi:Regulatory protein IclR [uncultured Desulfobacterium sp.]|uniref:Regulatory protein IclR n=1 Tax=uncultured Desulfobacterium sp. TaxID=201089 RepID=A0A445MWL2_9BACT|nr:Regulatory protein IclR [uncultured Desulfobacterium sp.]